jgi:molybdopterin molybdotransferase
MIPFEEAYARTMRHVRFLGEEEVPLAEAMGRVLAQDAVADVDMPPFDKAAMDGFACRREDLGGELRVVEELPAGAWPTREIGRGECARIMTGAPVPAGADCVVMVERTREEEPGRVRVESAGPETYICLRGEDVRTGDVVLRAGTPIGPAAIGVLAAIGRARPRVARRPKVAVLATGSELVEAGSIPGPGQIRSSNGPALCAQVASAGGVPWSAGVLADDREVIAGALRRAREEHDLILLSGGVSAGDYDFVPDILKKLGFSFEFDSVAMQPGRPTVFATDGRTACFGLPGNPVATFVVFELMVRPFLAGLMGRDFEPRIVQARLRGGLSRRHAERRLSLPVRFVATAEVEAIAYHGSAHLASLARAEGLVALPVDVREIPEGALVDVRLL